MDGQRHLGRASATFKQGEAAGDLLGAVAVDSSRRKGDGADQEAGRSADQIGGVRRWKRQRPGVGGGVKEAGGIGGFLGQVALGDGSGQGKSNQFSVLFKRKKNMCVLSLSSEPVQAQSEESSVQTEGKGLCVVTLIDTVGCLHCMG